MRRPFYYDPGANPQPRNYRLGTELFTPADKVKPNEKRRARKALQREHGVSGKAARHMQREAKRMERFSVALARVGEAASAAAAAMRAA